MYHGSLKTTCTNKIYFLTFFSVSFYIPNYYFTFSPYLLLCIWSVENFYCSGDLKRFANSQPGSYKSFFPITIWNFFSHRRSKQCLEQNTMVVIGIVFETYVNLTISTSKSAFSLNSWFSMSISFRPEVKVVDNSWNSTEFLSSNWVDHISLVILNFPFTSLSSYCFSLRDWFSVLCCKTSAVKIKKY